MPELPEHFKQVLANPTPENVDSMSAYARSGTFDQRIEMVENGMIDFITELFKLRPQLDVGILNIVWNWLHWFVIIDDLDDVRERGPGSTIDAVQSRGIFNEIMKDLPGDGPATDAIFGFVSWCGQDEAAIPALIETGMHREAIAHINARSRCLNQAMASMRALITLEGNPRKVVRADGGLDAVLPFLKDLSETTDGNLIRRAFRTASIVARLAGNDETGIGPQVLRGNPLLVQTLVTMLDKVIDAGPTGTVYNMGINPHLITLDIKVVASSDVNKPLLENAVAVLYKALVARGDKVVKMVQDIVSIYLLLAFDKSCLTQLQKLGKEKLSIFEKFIPADDRESLSSYQNLMSIVFPLPPAGTKANGGGAFKSIVGKVMSSGRNRAPSNTPQPLSGDNTKHVMLSYNWGIKPVVQFVNAELKRLGVPTWIDEEKMGANINDSMSEAVEGASHVVVFLTQKYKESGNCRRECEYADTAGVPVVYVMAEDGFKPTGWLALLMGKALYVNGRSIEEMRGNMGELVRRVSGKQVTSLPPGSGGDVKAAAPTSFSPSPATSEVSLALKAMMEKMEMMAEEIKQTRADIAQLRSEIRASRQ